MSTQNDMTKYDKILSLSSTSKNLKTRGGSFAEIQKILLTEGGFSGVCKNSAGEVVAHIQWDDEGNALPRNLFGYDLMVD